MRLIFFVLIFFTGTVLSKYYEKRRFDRSIYDYVRSPSVHKRLGEKWAYTDYETNFRAYIDEEGNNCFIEKLNNHVEDKENNLQEAERLTIFQAGHRIVRFCVGRKIIFIPTQEQMIDPPSNVFVYDENDSLTGEVAVVAKKPLISRIKRQTVFDEKQNFNKRFGQNRSRRQARQSVGRFRGQTQSQYLSIGNNDQKEGRAEAEATHESSRAVVSGNYGMGQAQSMSLGGTGCEDCPKYTSEGSRDRYLQISDGTTSHYGGIPLSRTGNKVSEGGMTNVYPGTISSYKQPGDSSHPDSISQGVGTIYPNKVTPDTMKTTGNIPYRGADSGTIPGGHLIYPSNIPVSVGNGKVPRYPANVYGENVNYPGDVTGAQGDTRPTYMGNVDGSMSRDRGLYPGGVPAFTTKESVLPPGQVHGSPAGTNRPYPVPIPGTPAGTNVPYPSGPTGPSRGNIPYPGDVPITPPEVKVPHTVIPPGTDGQMYPGSVPGFPSGGYISQPQNVLSPGFPTDTTAGAIPSGIHGTKTGDNVFYPGNVASVTGDGGVAHPGTVSVDTSGYSKVRPDRIPGGDVPYPGYIPGTTSAQRPTYAGSVPGVPNNLIQTDGTGYLLTPDRSRVYPGAVMPGMKDISPGQISPESGANSGAQVYPGGQIPGMHYFDGHYPTGRENNGRGGMYQGTGPLPGSSADRTIGSDARGVYPSGISPPGNQLRETLHYPGGVAPGTAGPPGLVPGIHGTISPTDRSAYPPSSYPETGRINIGNIMPMGATPGTGGTARYPDGTQGQVPTGHDMQYQKYGPDQSGISYPQDYTKYREDNRGAIYPNYPPQAGQYPSTGTWPGYEAGPKQINPQRNEQYPGEVRQQHPRLQYPTNVGLTTNTGDGSQYYQQANSGIADQDDNSDSQASSSVKQTDSGTQASATAQGKYGEGTSQSQVTGTYSGSGSFSAQAGSTDTNKSVQTEISGGKDGASSNAQGVGGHGKSQTQVQLNSESGATTTGAQSSGWNHGTNSQVKASSRGGLADAQANGEGSTSSQAQIGFQPYLRTDEKFEKRVRPFRGGGTASAQSGTHTGQSQSQLEGSFQYGITYTGAAQAGSGSGAAASRKPFNFSLTDTELFKPFPLSYTPQIVQKGNNSQVTNSSLDTDYEGKNDQFQDGLQTSSSISRKVIKSPNGNVQVFNTKPSKSDRSQTDDTVYEYEDEYDIDDYDTFTDQPLLNAKITKTDNPNHRQTQAIRITTENQHDVRVNQDTNIAQEDMFQSDKSLSGYNIPTGFHNKVTSIAGDETISQGDGKSQSQTVSVISQKPILMHENKSPISETRSLKTNHEKLMENEGLFKSQGKNVSERQNPQSSRTHVRPSEATVKPSYYTITNSIAGKMGDRSSPRKYEHRYYTKSSTCGYFTFSCNVVYGSNGRTKICKPKMPTYPDGTPMKC